MKKNIIYFLLICLIGFSYINTVKADDIAQAAVQGIQSDSLYNMLKGEYDNGIVTMTISQDNQPVIVYGHSICTTSGCEYTYQGVDSSDVEDLLSASIVCEDGSKSISYSLSASTADAYKATSYDYNHDVYWSEIYTVTCSSDGDVTLDDAGEYDDEYSGDVSDGETDDGYVSSTPGDTVDTGVETYYIILIIVAIVSYAIMKVIKKYNLFKNI